MDIIHTVPSLGESGGGPPRSVSQLCAALVVLDTSVSIVTRVDSDDPLVPLDPRIQLSALEHVEHSFLKRLCSNAFGQQVRRVVQGRCNPLLHQHGIWLRSSHEMTSAAYSIGVPLVVAPRGMLEPWALKHRRWKKEIAWALYQKRDLRRATAFHATALSEAESIRSLGFKQPIAVIPNGVQLPEAVECEGRNVGKLKGETKTALFLSRIHPKKGLPMLLAAWAELSPKDWRLVIAGNDNEGHTQELLAQVAKLGLQEVVEFIGPVFGADKASVYSKADLFVLPSHSENFGIVVAEALGHGLPVLTTTGCPWQELEAHSCGWWVEPTPEGVLRGLGEALGTDGKKLKVMGARGRGLVEDNYQWPSIAERMLEFYDWLLNGGTQPEFVM